MTKDQQVHVGMINSFNVITGKVSFRKIIDSGVGVFAHLPDEDIKYENVEFIMFYFEQMEMFSHCSELKKYLEENYNEDRTPKPTGCECDFPEITEYTEIVKCAKCKKTIS